MQFSDTVSPRILAQFSYYITNVVGTKWTSLLGHIVEVETNSYNTPNLQELTLKALNISEISKHMRQVENKTRGITHRDNLNKREGQPWRTFIDLSPSRQLGPPYSYTYIICPLSKTLDQTT